MVDTAGLRESGDAIEVEGVARARQAQAIAALTILAIDGSAAISDEDRARAASTGDGGLVVVTKSDLPRAWTRGDLGRDAASAIDVSVVTGEGLDDVRHAIVQSLTGRESLRDTPAISNARHLALVDEALAALVRARESTTAGATEELVLADLIAARSSLEAITGRRVPDDLLFHIFSRFCIGK
jgi:tRNA modification GTPase